MKKLSQEEKVNALTNFLRNVSKNEELFIFTMNKDRNAIFCIATKTDIGGIDTKTKFMTYEEMNAYFFGVLAVKNGTINF